MSNLDLPSFPGIGEKGAQVCARVRFYLAIVDELSFEQVRILSEHLKGCAQCAAEFQILRQATRLVATLPQSTPSARVDAAVLAALQHRQTVAQATARAHAPGRLRSGRRAWALVAALLTVIATGLFMHGLLAGSRAGLQLPANLSWHGYVLHYTQTMNNPGGQPYQIEVYQDLGTNNMHVESNLPGKFDVVVVTDRSTMLGKDMMHHIAQMGSRVEDWATDGSLFDLDQLRHDLATGSANYLGQGNFQGQPVYQIRLENGQILLLSMSYLPVNALRNFHGQGTGVPIYQTCQLLLFAQVSDSLWDMQVPSGFQMGQLPAHS
ncbi:MAG TPA: hypothetical protein VGF67_00565 [Ktedonobacteraceae bacterium]|jgi:hypothetical protein